jgi:hypothetical protein
MQSGPPVFESPPTGRDVEAVAGIVTLHGTARSAKVAAKVA